MNEEVEERLSGLIEAYWNVNPDKKLLLPVALQGLIEAYWNVNAAQN